MGKIRKLLLVWHVTLAEMLILADVDIFIFKLLMADAVLILLCIPSRTSSCPLHLYNSGLCKSLNVPTMDIFTMQIGWLMIGETKYNYGNSLNSFLLQYDYC